MPPVEHHIYGTKPRLLIVSGLHGDEYEAIDLVGAALKRYQAQLPDLVYIPQASPSAVAARTRHNLDGVDVNRQFVDDCQCVEARAIMELVQQWQFDACVSFHEDPQEDRFYFYASLEVEEDILAALRAELRRANIGLLNGVDDTEDACLGFEFVDGYRVCQPEPNGHLHGTLEGWAVTSGQAGRMFGIEVPGQLSLDKKAAVVEAVFKHLLI